jgi:3-methyladenine DNA glycosylase AlkD
MAKTARHPATVEELVRLLRGLEDPAARAGMARFGINPAGTLGVSVTTLRAIARRTVKNHRLALDLWETGIHEARILASLVDEPGRVSARQMETWAKDFDSWDVVDQVCSNLFDGTPFAVAKVAEWTGREAEFVKRAGFVLMACLVVHDKAAPDSLFLGFLPLIEREAGDDRNFVRKAVNWALRQIGKRNMKLHRAAVAAARRMRKTNSRSARWIAADALRELESEPVRARLSAGKAKPASPPRSRSLRKQLLKPKGDPR